MNCECCSRYPRAVGNKKFANSAGKSQFKHDTLAKHNQSLKHRVCRDTLLNEKATPLSAAFRRQEAVHHAADEAEIMLKFNTAYYVAKEEVPFTKFKSSKVRMNERYSNDTACAQFVSVIADLLKGKRHTKITALYLSIMTDGDTDASTKECEIIQYTHRSFTKGEPETF